MLSTTDLHPAPDIRLKPTFEESLKPHGLPYMQVAAMIEIGEEKGRCREHIPILFPHLRISWMLILTITLLPLGTLLLRHLGNPSKTQVFASALECMPTEKLHPQEMRFPEGPGLWHNRRHQVTDMRLTQPRQQRRSGMVLMAEGAQRIVRRHRIYNNKDVETTAMEDGIMMLSLSRKETRWAFHVLLLLH